AGIGSVTSRVRWFVGSGQSLVFVGTLDLLFALPVVRIYFLGQVAQVVEVPWFANTADFVFDAVGQTRVEVVMKGTISVALDLRCDAVEFNHVLINMVVVLHLEVVKLILSVSDRVVGAKRGL